MFTYEVGKPYPHPEKKAPGTEVPSIILTNASFDILFYSENPEADKAFYTTSPLQYGVFQAAHIPYIVFNFPGYLNFEVTINILKTDPEQAEKWMNTRSNGVTMFLIHAHSNIIHGLRFIGIQPAVEAQIKDICEQQDHHYDTPEAVDAQIEAFTARYTSAEILKMTRMYKL